MPRIYYVTHPHFFDHEHLVFYEHAVVAKHEEAGAEAEQLVVSEQEDKLPFFVKIKKESDIPLLEDRLFLRFGPRVILIAICAVSAPC